MCFHNFSSRKYQIFSNGSFVHWNEKLVFNFSFVLKTEGLYLYLYIYIFIYPLLSFDLALLCKFSSNTRSGTALGRVGSWTGRIKCSNKSNTELWKWQRPLLDYSGLVVDWVLESQYWRKSFPAKSFLLVALQWQQRAAENPLCWRVFEQHTESLPALWLLLCSCPWPLTSLWRTATEKKEIPHRNQVLWIFIGSQSELRPWLWKDTSSGLVPFL